MPRLEALVKNTPFVGILFASSYFSWEAGVWRGLLQRQAGENRGTVASTLRVRGLSLRVTVIAPARVCCSVVAFDNCKPKDLTIAMPHPVEDDLLLKMTS